MCGAARDEEGPLPYAPIAEALDRLLAARPDLAFSLTGAARAELARVTAALPAQPTDPEPRAERQRIFSSVAQVFARAAGERGAVLLLDDLHAADEATLQLLHYLARRARFQRLLIVMSFRVGPGSPRSIERAQVYLSSASSRARSRWPRSTARPPGLSRSKCRIGRWLKARLTRSLSWRGETHSLLRSWRRR